MDIAGIIRRVEVHDPSYGPRRTHHLSAWSQGKMGLTLAGLKPAQTTPTRTIPARENERTQKRIGTRPRSPSRRGHPQQTSPGKQAIRHRAGKTGLLFPPPSSGVVFLDSPR
jgi:hypothetical protein